MKNLSVLLALQKEKHEHVMLGDNGVYTGMEAGAKGVVTPTLEAIAFHLFGEYKLSDENAANFRLLTKLRLPKVKKPKEQKGDGGKTATNTIDPKKQIGKVA